MRILILVFVAGLVLGLSTNDFIVTNLPKMQAKYQIGDCLSNGLYVEKVIEIRTSAVLKQKEYVLQGVINNKYILPDTTPSWIIDTSSVLVNNKNCELRI